MPMLPKTIVDANLRNRIFANLFGNSDEAMEYNKVNDRQRGTIIVDDNGVERYCRVGIIVAELREDMTARELMQKEIDEYNAKQASKAEKAKAKEEKIARDKKAREEKNKKEEEGE